MNPFAKLCCRIYQGAFRIVMPLLPYREPNILPALPDLISILQKKKISSVLLVTDPALRRMEMTTDLELLLHQNTIHCAVYDQTCANPTVQNVEEARQCYLDNHCQALIAFGGGSSIDCAKAVGARIAFPKKSLNQLKGLLKVWKKIPLLTAIPTTAGTGSEVTVTSVITDSEKKHKYTMNNFTFIPSYAVLEPSVTYTLPPLLTATTGMDVLTHAVEAYLGRSTTKETEKLALEATALVFQNILTAYSDGTNRQARNNMLHAAYKAGIAFSKSYVGYIHAIAHSLGGQYNIPHGLANSVLMPIVLKEYGSAVHKKLHRLGIAAGVCSPEDTPEEGANALIDAILELNQKMGLPEALAGIKKEDIPVMAKHAAKEANPLYPVPILMNAKELERFYYKAADWSEQ